MHVLVTGCAGYIGSVLTRQLLGKGHRVRGYDALLFGGDSMLDVFTVPDFEFVGGDVRDEATVRSALAGVDAVVHLAAIVGDPACAKQPDLARAVNLEASKTLLALCNENLRIQKFVFASTCSNYGKMQGSGYLDENSPLRPVSLYAEVKVAFEEHVLGAKLRPDLAATALRFATVYGISPRMRFDLTVNEFVRELALGRPLVVFGEEFWRPYCHIKGTCAVGGARHRVARGQSREVFNVGDSDENYTKEMILLAIFEALKDVPRTRHLRHASRRSQDYASTDKIRAQQNRVTKRVR